MTDLRKAAEQALDFMDWLCEWLCGDDNSARPKYSALNLESFLLLARTELRQALAQPVDETAKGEQEPVCFLMETAWNYEIANWGDPNGFPVYTAPPQRKTLAELLASTPECSDHPDAPHGFDRNASHSADRYVCECESWEPVDAVNMCQERVHKTDKLIEEIIQLRDTIVSLKHDTALQNVGTAQQVPTKSDANIAHINRQWVGLTDDERYEATSIPRNATLPIHMLKAIEAKLKEKNT